MSIISRARLLGHLHNFTSSLDFLIPSSIRAFSSSTVPSLFQRIGFVGLGNMGSRMVNNLIKAGYHVTVHDANDNAMKIYKEKGIPTKQTPYEVAESSDVVITMLPSPSHVSEVYTGSNGLLQGQNDLRPWLFLDSSTIDPNTSRKISALIADCSLREKKYMWESPVMLDAPVSGGVIAADTGMLTFMVGGPKEAYEAAKPLLFSMGKNTIYCGGAGNGSAAKICNNLAMAISMLGVSEAFTLGQKLGIAASTLTNILNSSSARCWSSDTYNPVPGVIDGTPACRNYVGGFASKLMAKDLNLAIKSAEGVRVKCPVTLQAEKIFTELCKDGHDTKDFSSVFRYYYAGDDEVTSN